MRFADALRAWLIHLTSIPLCQQLAPFFVFFLIPAIAFLLASRVNDMVGLDSFSILAPWKWLTNSTSSSSTKSSSGGHHHRHHHHKHLTKKHGRPRSEQQAALANGSAKPALEFDCYYPGLVNISGTYCFMNSTLQALASLSYLQPHIDSIHGKAEILDVPTPVIDSLQYLLHLLNTPRSSYSAIRPFEMIDALANVEGRTNALFYSREHQDAQELFQLLSECIKNEITAVDKEAKRDRGLGGLSQDPETTKEIGKSVFDGLTANRRSCVTCEYTEAVMHFSLDNLQLSLPRYATACRLEDCLEEYTRLEILRDCVCRKCSLVATHRRLQHDVALLDEATKPEMNPSHSKKRRFKDVRRMEARVRSALEEGRIEDDLKDVRLERVVSPATKQAMIARPPPVLALHINRSIHYGQYAAKNTVRLVFPEILDITPYTTSGNLSTKPTSSISTPPPANSGNSHRRRPSTPTPSTYSNIQPRTLYRLSAVVCHYGQHSFGHYICYRRKPRSTALPWEKRWAPPKLADPLLLHELDQDQEKPHSAEGSRTNGRARPDLDRVPGSDPEPRNDYPRFVWDGEDPDEYGPGTGKGWLRISDDAVRECGIESVLAEGSGAFMLYYERVVSHRLWVYPSRGQSQQKARAGAGAVNNEGEKKDNVVNRECAQEHAPSAEEDAGGESEGGEYADGDMGRESEETLRPKTKTVVMNGNANTLVREVGIGVVTKSSRRASSPPLSVASEPTGTLSRTGLGRAFSVGARIIRSVEAGRNMKRSGSSATVPPSIASSYPSSAAPSPCSSLILEPTSSLTSTLPEQSAMRSPSESSAATSVTSSMLAKSNSKSKKSGSPPRPEAGGAGDARTHRDQDKWEYVRHEQPPQSPSVASSPTSSPPRPSSAKHKPNTLKRRSKQTGSTSGKKSATSTSPPMVHIAEAVGI